MPRFVFEEIVCRAERSGKCVMCGKRWKKVKKFSQTVNPFNRNDDGSQKSRDQIWAELRAEAKAWQPAHCVSSVPA
jgi:hypothetical protein